MSIFVHLVEDITVACLVCLDKILLMMLLCLTACVVVIDHLDKLTFIGQRRLAASLVVEKSRNALQLDHKI